MSERALEATKTAQGVPVAGNTLYQGVVFVAEGEIVNAAAAERFRIVRAKIERENLTKRPHQVIAVTSAVPAEGKSFCAVNLARALSVDHVGKTLLVDCDLRRPTVHQFFRVDRDGGLSEALLRRKLTAAEIRSVGENLDLVTAGAPVEDAAQVVEQPELSHFLTQLRKYYRYVVVDLPPILLVPEPISVSCAADTVLLVVRAGSTDRRMVRDAIRMVEAEKLLGVVLNEGVDPTAQYLDYSYYGFKGER